MKIVVKSVILIFVCASFVCIASEPSVNAKRSIATDVDASNAQSSPSFALSYDGATNGRADETQNDLPYWYESAEWWLFIAAIPTLIFVGWQAKETASAAAAANRNVEAVMDERRARVEIIAGGVPVDADKPIGIGVSLKNGGPTMAFIKGGRVRLLRADKEIEPDYGAGVDIPFTGAVPQSYQTPTQMAVLLEPNPTLTANQVVEINGRKSFIHFYGFVRYQDIYKRAFEVRIHLRWFVYTGLVMAGQCTVWWEPTGKQEDNSDEEKKPSKKSWIERLDGWLDACSPD
jgi:hypothetical protein